MEDKMAAGAFGRTIEEVYLGLPWEQFTGNLQDLMDTIQLHLAAFRGTYCCTGDF